MASGTAPLAAGAEAALAAGPASGSVVAGALCVAGACFTSDVSISLGACRTDAITAMKPGGLHIMLMGLAAPLVESESFPLTLTFERAGSLTLEVTVMTIGARHGRK